MPREMSRGAVYRAPIALPLSAAGGGSSATLRQKYMVVLQGGPLFAVQRNVAVVLASTLRRQGPPRPFEVYVGADVGFHHDTVIDGRWVVTILKDEIPETARALVLPVPVMDEVSVAIAAGLQL